MTTKVEFTYIIGGNIEIDVEADIDYPDADFTSISVNAKPIDEEDIYVMDWNTKKPEALTALLYQRAMEEYHNALADSCEDDDYRVEQV